MEQEARTLLARIDERTRITHDLVKSHIERNDKVHDQLHSRVDRLSRTVYIGSGALTLVSAAALAWIKGIFGGPAGP